MRSAGTEHRMWLLLGVLVWVFLPRDVSCAADSDTRRTCPLSSVSLTTEHASSAAEQKFPACFELQQIELPRDFFAHYFDCGTGMSNLIVLAGGNGGEPLLRVELDSDAQSTVHQLPVLDRIPWSCIDVDHDGRLELLTAAASEPIGGSWYEIYSAPDWHMRARFVFPSMNFVSPPVTVDADDDAYWEVYLTPSSLGGASIVAFADYDPARDTFTIIASAPAPFRTSGQTAAGDFDDDGRVEFVTGNRWGYSLFEFDGQSLNYGGRVGPDSADGSFQSAIACRPKPDGLLYALVGSALGYGGYRASLLEPIGDNQFEISHTFSAAVPASGSHNVYADDIDCDGLDELLVVQDSTRVWEWDENVSDFIQVCAWSRTFRFQSTDLDQDGAKEWTGDFQSSATAWTVRAVEDPRCGGIRCGCPCQGDPECDGVTDVLDIVRVIDRAFRAYEAVNDYSCTTPTCVDGLTDVDCSGDTDIVDVVRLISVAIRGQSPLQSFCQPCL